MLSNQWKMKKKRPSLSGGVLVIQTWILFENGKSFLNKLFQKDLEP